MNLVEHYNNLYLESMEKIKSGNYQTDNLMDSALDKRRGITLLTRPNEHVKSEIHFF